MAASTKYKLASEKQKEKDKVDIIGKKRKAGSEKLEALKNEKRCLLFDISKVIERADQLAVEVEINSSIALIIKLKSLRKTLKE